MDWDNRELCPDGACVGLIRADGTCNVCGRAVPNWGDERRRGLVATEADDSGDTTASESESESGDTAGAAEGIGIEAAASAPAAGPTEGSDEWEDRALCPDGGCTGLIDPATKRCSVCRRSIDEVLASLT